MITLAGIGRALLRAASALRSDRAGIPEPEPIKKPKSAPVADQAAKASVPKYVEADTQEQKELMRAEEQAPTGLTPAASRARAEAQAADRRADSQPKPSETVANAFAQHRAAAPSRGISR